MNEIRTVSEIAIANPATIRVFETLGIDYCCGGKRSLRDACAHANVPLEDALEALSRIGQSPTAEIATGWNSASLSALCDRIVATHHGYVRQETPRLAGLLAKVVGKHGATHPEVRQIEDLFTAMSQELSMHMMKEEQVLFPYLARMEAAHLTGRPLPPACFDSVTRPIANMLADHDDAGAVLARMRELSNGYTPPEGACPTFHNLYRGLQDFEHDLHQHVHLENNILFARAVEMESSAAPAHA